jgi:4-hydroxybenzoate polyprenyltransferase/phosphoserine phosphatase
MDQVHHDQKSERGLPLCVDLDGTLIRSDVLHESLAAALHRWGVLLRVPLWLLRGRAHVKAQLAARADLDPALLPYRRELVDFLEAQKRSGRRIVLATAANARIAESIGRHLGLFDEIITSSASHNLRGADKRAALIERFGERGFSYAGNDRADLEVWRAAGSAILVDAPARVSVRARELAPVEESFAERGHPLAALARALRPYQWVKNLLVFVPIVTAGALHEAHVWLAALWTFLAFCATASAIYLINDLADLQADRRHPRKRFRPFASGELPIAFGFAAAPLLLLLGLALAGAGGTADLVAAYAVASVLYSSFLKQKPLIDVFTLAGLYTLRLFAGGAATGIDISLWLLAFSGFLFLSLAFVKRVSELRAHAPGTNLGDDRGYARGDVAFLEVLGIGASFASSVVLALYVQSDYVASVYANPEVVWLIVPLMLFWQCRLWMSTTRGYMHDDPIVYCAKDWVSQCVLLALLAVIAAGHLT